MKENSIKEKEKTSYIENKRRKHCVLIVFSFLIDLIL
jgi:hypothetical protein